MIHRFYYRMTSSLAVLILGELLYLSAVHCVIEPVCPEEEVLAAVIELPATETEEEIVSEIYVEETETETETEVDNARIIVGFGDFDIAENYIYVNVNHKPDLEQLAEFFPETISVLLEGEEENCEIETAWAPLEDDYENTDLYYYEFIPFLDETLYRYQDEEIAQSVPYVGVFVGNYNTGGKLAITSQTNGRVAVTTDKQAVFNFLINEAGFPPAAACGIMANLAAESNFNSYNLEQRCEVKYGYDDVSYTTAVDTGEYTNFITDYAGYGLMQWTVENRKRALWEKAQQMKVSIGNMHMQLQFMMEELTSSQKSYLKNIPNNDKGAFEAAYYFCVNLERPKNYENEGIVRGNLARNFYWPTFAHGKVTPCEHHYKDFIVQPATCITEGLVKRTCDYCGESSEEAIPVDLTKHEGETQLRDVLLPTDGKAGYSGNLYCLSCNNLIQPGKEVDTLDEKSLPPNTIFLKPGETPPELPEIPAVEDVPTEDGENNPLVPEVPEVTDEEAADPEAPKEDPNDNPNQAPGLPPSQMPGSTQPPVLQDDPVDSEIPEQGPAAQNPGSSTEAPKTEKEEPEKPTLPEPENKIPLEQQKPGSTAEPEKPKTEPEKDPVNTEEPERESETEQPKTEDATGDPVMMPEPDKPSLPEQEEETETETETETMPEPETEKEEAVTITSQPQNQTVTEEEEARFALSASGSNLTYLWQSCPALEDGSCSNNWTAIGHESSLQIGSPASYKDYYFRCVVSNSSSSETSHTVRLTVYES